MYQTINAGRLYSCLKLSLVVTNSPQVRTQNQILQLLNDHAYSGTYHTTRTIEQHNYESIKITYGSVNLCEGAPFHYSFSNNAEDRPRDAALANSQSTATNAFRQASIPLHHHFYFHDFDPTRLWLSLVSWHGEKRGWQERMRERERPLRVLIYGCWAVFFVCADVCSVIYFCVSVEVGLVCEVRF